jgi:hypothetical protein
MKSDKTTERKKVKQEGQKQFKKLKLILTSPLLFIYSSIACRASLNAPDLFDLIS